MQKSLNIPREIQQLKKKEIVAIIAYLQRLGTDIKAKTANK
jgi:cbb3-type cytochrome oxidase cytochrome c subunit